jgi:hypothetical protein
MSIHLATKVLAAALAWSIVLNTLGLPSGVPTYALPLHPHRHATNKTKPPSLVRRVINFSLCMLFPFLAFRFGTFIALASSRYKVFVGLFSVYWRV